jgi:hypothetical protein
MQNVRLQQVVYVVVLCLCLLAGQVLSLALATPAYGATHGIYTLTATPHYQHPVTGVIEDSGQNPGIGQGMTESVLGKQALLEVDEQGKHYITVRYSLMDNIQDVKLSYQRSAQGEWVTTEATIIREDMEEGIADLRFAVSDENAIVRAEFYVIPMGRVVVFYSAFSNPVPGSGDFVTSISVNEDIAAAQASRAAQQAQGTTASSQEGAAAAGQAAGANEASAATATAPLDPSAGLSVYLNDGSTPTAEGAAGAPSALAGLASLANNQVVLFILGVVVLVALAVAIGAICLKVARKRQAV